MQIEQDIERFSKLHGWAKHLTLEGQPYLLFPWKGQQPKTPFEPDVSDTEGIHWWAWDAKDINEIPICGVGKDIIMRHPVEFNCCLRGIEAAEDGTRYIDGIATIERTYPDYEAILRGEYPYVDSLEKIFYLDSLRQKKKAEYTAHLIRVLFEEKCPEWLAADDRRANVLRMSGGDDSAAAIVCGRSPPVRSKKSGLFRRAKSARDVTKGGKN